MMTCNHVYQQKNKMTRKGLQIKVMTPQLMNKFIMFFVSYPQGWNSCKLQALSLKDDPKSAHGLSNLCKDGNRRMKRRQTTACHRATIAAYQLCLKNKSNNSWNQICSRVRV